MPSASTTTATTAPTMAGVDELRRSAGGGEVSVTVVESTPCSDIPAFADEAFTIMATTRSP